MHPRLAPTFLALALGLLAGCRSAPLALPAPIQVSPPRDDVREVILRGMRARGWQTVEEEPGRIRAEISVRAHRGTVDILYTPTQVSFAHVGTQNLDERQRNGQIVLHTNYNSWLRYLRSDIERELYQPTAG